MSLYSILIPFSHITKICFSVFPLSCLQNGHLLVDTSHAFVISVVLVTQWLSALNRPYSDASWHKSYLLSNILNEPALSNL